MKVVHICMVAYIDGWGYQDNLLPDYMSKAGHSVIVVSSSNHFPSCLKRDEEEAILKRGGDYYNGNVHVYRIPTYLSTSNYSFFCKGLSSILRKERPEMIFHHGVNSSSMLICWNYVRTHNNVYFFIDNHSDTINQSKNNIWQFVNRRLFRWCVQLVSPHVTKFFGVTPGRCDYLVDVFKAPQTKVSLLPIGSDTDVTDSICECKEDLRKKYGLPQESFVVVSGGKMGEDKGHVALINAFHKISEAQPNIVLLLFGSFIDEQTHALAKKTPNVYMFGWCDRTKTLELLKLSDIACWPIHHTTLIEDAIGCSLPIVVRRTPNTSHLIDGNGLFVENGSCEELQLAILSIINSYSEYKIQSKKMHGTFSYKSIVKIIEKECNEG